MYTKFLLRQLPPHSQLQKLSHGFCRSFGSASALNDSMKRSVGSDNQLILPSITTSASQRMSFEYHKRFRELHIGNTCLLKEGKGAGKENPNITYAIVPRERSHIASDFLIRYYHTEEPITKALGIPMDEIGHWFHEYVRMSMYASVTDATVQVIDESEKKRVGVFVSIIVDPVIMVPASILHFFDSKTHPVKRKMADFLDKLQEGLSVANYRTSPEDAPAIKIQEHMYACVHPDYGGQGITHKMVGMAETIAATVLNCRIGYAVVTSAYTYKIFKSRGYEVVKEIQYVDYANSKGEKLFADKIEQMKPHTTCRVMVKQYETQYD